MLPPTANEAVGMILLAIQLILNIP